MAFDLLLVSLLLAPLTACALLAFVAWFRVAIPERSVSLSLGIAFSWVVVGAATLIAWMLVTGRSEHRVSLGPWFQVSPYAFSWTLLADRLSLPFALFSGMLVGIIGAFSRRYLHLEPGFLRFYLLLGVFGASVELVVLAGSLDLVFLGWELVGLTSALLIAFFHERPKPVEHGLRAFATYRVCDVGLLGAVVWLHHEVGSTAFASVRSGDLWAGLAIPASAASALFVALLVLWATMGKSAQVPLGGWLPRAMEGPTPSSAIFYGAISIHLGPYLLLRSAPLIERVPLAIAAVIAVGAATALHGNFVGRVQTDVKSVLAYASMTQVGLIFVEIGLGLRTLALMHIVGHAAIRSLQILRSPSLLHDHHHLEEAIGRALPRSGVHLERLVPARWQPWLYRHALERGFFDALLRDHVVRPFLGIFRVLDRWDRRLAEYLAGRALDTSQPHAGTTGSHEGTPHDPPRTTALPAARHGAEARTSTTGTEIPR